MQNPWNRDDANEDRSGPRHSGVPNNGAGHSGVHPNAGPHSGARSNVSPHNGGQNNGGQNNGGQNNGGARTNRPHTNGAQHNGARHGGIHAKSTELPAELSELVAEPLDMRAVHADDELINALSGGNLRISPGLGESYDTDDHIVAMLAAWRDEVSAEPIGELVSVDEASAAILAAQRPQRRARYLVPVAAAAALVAFACSGVAIGAHSAEPGDTLWGVSKVLYSERATSVEAATDVKGRLQKATDALVAGNPQAARQELAAAGAGLPEIRSEEGQDDLAAQTSFLMQKAATTPPGVRVDPRELSPPHRRGGGSGSKAPSASVPPSAAVVQPSGAPSSAVVEPGGAGGTSGSSNGQPDASTPAHSSGAAEGARDPNPPQSLSAGDGGTATAAS